MGAFAPLWLLKDFIDIVILMLDLWFAGDNRFLNPESSYGRILMAPPCRLIYTNLRLSFIKLNFYFHRKEFRRKKLSLEKNCRHFEKKFLFRLTPLFFCQVFFTISGILKSAKKNLKN